MLPDTIRVEVGPEPAHNILPRLVLLVSSDDLPAGNSWTKDINLALTAEQRQRG